MSRKMIEVHGKIFRHLEHYCAISGNPVQSLGLRRYIKAPGDEEKEFLTSSTFHKGHTLKLSHRQSLVHVEHDETHYVGLIGFDHADGIDSRPWMHSINAVDADYGISMTILSEALPMPAATSFQVRDFVEAGSMDDDPYPGHSFEQLSPLFPRILTFQSGNPLDAETLARVYLMICAEECSRGALWIESELAEEITRLAELDLPSMPHLGICRALFDPDPRSLFMALYRCIEATYAYEASTSVIDALGLSIEWVELAATLQRRVGWRPQESGSLNQILRHATEGDLRIICDCLDETISTPVHTSAAKAIYRLRNSIVHFRPGLDFAEVDNFDWNRLCTALVGVIFDVYCEAYASRVMPGSAG